MHTIRGAGGFVVGLALAACTGDQAALAPEAGPRALQAGAVTASVTGSGHHTRIVAGVEDLTTFSFTAQQRADGTTSGQYQYTFRAAGFSVHGPVTCLSIRGNEAWIGGTVGHIKSPDPEDQSLVGADMWWRLEDNGEGASDAPDRTTGVGFAFSGSTITAESWCRDQPALLILRDVESGNIEVRAD
ncbi:MAG TPA: hypothetical protein VNO19_13510 [Gemmatimonadales bacterium]|nr:hypothetical protein [Gemmatimonadales bacterium]